MSRALSAHLVSGAILLSGCGDGSTAPETLTGTYALATIDGMSLPYTLFEEQGGKLEVLAGGVVFESAGTFSSVVDFRETVGEEVLTSVEEVEGTYTRSGNTVRLTIPDDEDSPYTVTLSGSTVSIVLDGLTWRYSRVN